MVPGNVLATGGMVAKFVGVTATTVVATPNVSCPQAPTVVPNTAIVIALANNDPTLGIHFLELVDADIVGDVVVVVIDLLNVDKRVRTRKHSRSLCPLRGGALMTFVRLL